MCIRDSLGGAVAGLAFACEMPLILLLVGLIYIIETLSVILQVTYFKATHGKRVQDGADPPPL